VVALIAAATLAQRVGVIRSKAENELLSITTYLEIRGKLRDAEEALILGDAAAAGDRLAAAQNSLDKAMSDVEQKNLRDMLAQNLETFFQDHGKAAQEPTETVAAVAPQSGSTSAPGSAANPLAGSTAAGIALKRRKLDQPTDRDPWIMALVDQLNRDIDDLRGPPAQEVLDIERDWYVAYIWAEYVEWRLKVLADPQLSGRLSDMQELARELLKFLKANPKSEHVAVLLDLLRNDVTLADIRAALKADEMRIDCNTRPQYYESVQIAFTFISPRLADVPAATRLLSYAWEIDDETTPPPEVDRFRHYFRPRKPARRLPTITLKQPFINRPKAPDATATPYNVKVTVSLPFGDPTLTVPLRPQPIVPRYRDVSGWFEPMELASFCVTAAIAVVTAFGAQYATSIPNVVTWSDWLTAFMLGFGLDQMRDTVSGASATGAAASTVPATPAAPAAPLAKPTVSQAGTQA
jgi:hypothetical protein